MTTLSSLEVESYFERVYEALADLPEDVREELLEELPDHLTEVAAEEDGRLVDRLGEPEAYAAELRAAAGYEPVPSTPESERNLLVDWGRRIAVGLSRIDERGGRWTGYARLTELVQALRPGWWVLRGWLIAQLVSGAHDRSSWHGFLPSVGESKVLGLVLLLVAVVGSVWLGRHSVDWSSWPRRILAAVSIVLAIWGADLLVRSVGSTEYVYSSYDSNPQRDVQDLYVYDQNGNLVPNARVYDQNGNPVQLGSVYCPDGSISADGSVNSDGSVNPDGSVNADGTGPRAWTYPICPSAAGPFQAGPGAVTGLSSPSASASRTPTPAPSAQASAKSTARGTATVKPKPTPTG